MYVIHFAMIWNYSTIYWTKFTEKLFCTVPNYSFVFGLATETVDFPQVFPHGGKTKWWLLHVKRWGENLVRNLIFKSMAQTFRDMIPLYGLHVNKWATELKDCKQNMHNIFCAAWNKYIITRSFLTSDPSAGFGVDFPSSFSWKIVTNIYKLVKSNNVHPHKTTKQKPPMQLINKKLTLFQLAQQCPPTLTDAQQR